MNKGDLCSRATTILRENGVRKSIPAQKTSFKIVDEEGHAKTFNIKKEAKAPLLNSEDVKAVLDALLLVVEDALKHGESVNIWGFATLGIKYRAARRIFNVLNHEPMVLPGHFVPNFIPGGAVNRAIKFYEQSVDDEEVRRSMLDQPNDDEADEADGE